MSHIDRMKNKWDDWIRHSDDIFIGSFINKESIDLIQKKIVTNI